MVQRRAVCAVYSVALFSAIAAIGRGQESASKNVKAEPAAVLDLPASEGAELSAQNGWSGVPDFLKGAVVQSRPLGRSEKDAAMLSLTVKSRGVLLVATAWDHSSTPAGTGDRLQVRQSLKKLAEQGWVLVAVFHRQKGAGLEINAVLRQNVAPGAPIKFQAPRFGAPAVLTVGDKQVQTIQVLPSLEFTAVDMSHVRPLPEHENLKRDDNGVVVLLTDEPISISAGLQKAGHLRRELVRQSLLIAARDGMGLATRDRTLREDTAPAGGPPLRILVEQNTPQQYAVTVFRQRGTQFDVLWDGEIATPLGTLEDLAARVEEFSRGTFVKVLEAEGYHSRVKPFRPTAAIPDKVEELLGEFNFISEFDALRRLHAEVARTGESPELLAALARGYALLAAETDGLWSPAHHALHARAMLYGYRLAARTNAGADANWNLAFVKSLLGWHQSALAHLTAAKSVAGGQPPVWVEGLTAVCEFDRERQTAAEAEDKVKPLIRFHQMLETEFAAGTRQRVDAIGRVYEVRPDCIRALHLLSDVHALGIAGTSAQQLPIRLAGMLYRRVEKIQGLPPDVLKVCATRTRQAASDEEEDDSPAGASQNEVEARSTLAELLRRHGRPQRDRTEPSLDFLATLIQEMTFAESTRVVRFRRTWLSVSADDVLQSLSPLAASHPYAGHLLSQSSDRQAGREAQGRLLTYLDDNRFELEQNEAEMFALLPVPPGQPYHPLWAQASWRSDWSFRDIAYIVQQRSATYCPDYEISVLRFLSPNSALAMATTVAVDWPTAEPLAREIEKRYAYDLRVLQALSDQYLVKKRWEDAERCLKLEVREFPEIQSYTRLANAYKARDDRESWKRTLEEFLTQESFGLEHARINVEIADDHMLRKEFDQALPYAQAAAQTWSAFGLLSAHRCYDGMQDWDNAELYVRRCTERYDEAWTRWYGWCLRRGHGNDEAARQHAARALAALGDSPPVASLPKIGLFHLLSDNRQEALSAFRKSFAATADPKQGLYAVLVAQELGESKARDELLVQVQARGKSFKHEGRVRTDLLELAALFERSLDVGNSASFDRENAEKVVKSSPVGEATEVQFLIGKFLSLTGREEDSQRFLKLAASSPVDCPGRTIASVLLNKQSIEIPETRQKE